MSPYSEHVGVKRQQEGNRGEMAAREKVMTNPATLHGTCFRNAFIPLVPNVIQPASTSRHMLYALYYKNSS